MTKVMTENFSMDRKKDGMGNLSVATRRVTAENAPISDFCEIRKVPSRLLAVPPKKTDVTKVNQMNLRRIRKQNFPVVLSGFSLSAKSRKRSGKVRFRIL